MYKTINHGCNLHYNLVQCLVSSGEKFRAETIHIYPKQCHPSHCPVMAKFPCPSYDSVHLFSTSALYSHVLRPLSACFLLENKLPQTANHYGQYRHRNIVASNDTWTRDPAIWKYKKICVFIVYQSSLSRSMSICWTPVFLVNWFPLPLSGHYFRFADFLHSGVDRTSGLQVSFFVEWTNFPVYRFISQRNRWYFRLPIFFTVEMVVLPVWRFHSQRSGSYFRYTYFLHIGEEHTSGLQISLIVEWSFFRFIEFLHTGAELTSGLPIFFTGD